MEIGNKIWELRKKDNLSQEQLAEKMNVTRQTISKWELNETTPDIKQAKELSKIFKINLDELTDNNINNLIIEKMSNTERLAGLVLKISKYIGICFLIMLIIDITSFIVFILLK
jgi:transcriptional regulator with XRE-family HTH domain